MPRREGKVTGLIGTCAGLGRAATGRAGPCHTASAQRRDCSVDMPGGTARALLTSPRPGRCPRHGPGWACLLVALRPSPHLARGGKAPSPGPGQEGTVTWPGAGRHPPWPRTGRCAHSCGWGPCRWGTAAGWAHTRHTPGGHRARRRWTRSGPGTPCRSAPPSGAAAAPLCPGPLDAKTHRLLLAPLGSGPKTPPRTLTSALRPGPTGEAGWGHTGVSGINHRIARLTHPRVTHPPLGGSRPHLAPWCPLTGSLLCARAARGPGGRELWAVRSGRES